jgi:hypothetical protein
MAGAVTCSNAWEKLVNMFAGTSSTKVMQTQWGTCESTSKIVGEPKLCMQQKVQGVLVM